MSDEGTTHSALPVPSPSKQVGKRTGKLDHKISNQLDWKAKVCEEEDPDMLATEDAHSLIANYGNYNVIVKINEIGATPHKEWYGNLRGHAPSLEGGCKPGCPPPHKKTYQLIYS